MKYGQVRKFIKFILNSLNKKNKNKNKNKNKSNIYNKLYIKNLYKNEIPFCYCYFCFISSINSG